MKKYQVYAHITLLVDGYIKARSKKEAAQKYKDFIERQISQGEVEITDVNIDNLCSEKDFIDEYGSEKEAITTSSLII